MGGSLRRAIGSALSGLCCPISIKNYPAAQEALSASGTLFPIGGQVPTEPHRYGWVGMATDTVVVPSGCLAALHSQALLLDLGACFFAGGAGNQSRVKG